MLQPPLDPKLVFLLAFVKRKTLMLSKKQNLKSGKKSKDKERWI